MAGEQILVVDDEPGVRTALEGILTDEGYRVTSSHTGEEGLKALEANPVDAVLLDVWLPGMDGLETLKMIRERRIDSEVVMISGHGTIETAVRATKLGAFDFVEKPLSLEKTLLVLRNALRQRRLERRNRQLLDQLDVDTEILGHSPAAERLRKEVELASETDAALLILGEPGSGREMVARRVHASGSRAGRAFVEVPCGALDPTAAPSALFGSTAVSGRIELASGGSLFLEDLDRLTPEIQERLAGQLAKNARRTGTRTMASARNEEAVLAALRPIVDAIRIQVPSLKDRRADIPLLAERFMRDLAREYGREAKPLSPDAVRVLQGHDWPGNVRELHNVVERLLLFAPDGGILEQHLPENLGGSRAPAEDLYGEFESLVVGVRAFERHYIHRVLTEEGGDRRGAAKRLGISEGTLRKRLSTLF